METCGAAAVQTSRRRLDPEERARRRRKQHRELVARGRAETKGRLAGLREQDVRLQQAISAIVDAFTTAQCACSRTDAASLRDRVVGAVVLQESLRRDNERLQNAIDSHRRVREDVAAVPSEAPCDAFQVLHRRGFWTYFANDDVPIYFEPYHDDQCEQHMATANHNAKRLDEAFREHRLPTMSMLCFGWTVQRTLDQHARQKLRFHFNREVSTADSQQMRESLARQRWAILNTTDRDCTAQRWSSDCCSVWGTTRP